MSKHNAQFSDAENAKFNTKATARDNDVKTVMQKSAQKIARGDAKVDPVGKGGMFVPTNVKSKGAH